MLLLAADHLLQSVVFAFVLQPMQAPMQVPSYEMLHEQLWPHHIHEHFEDARLKHLPHWQIQVLLLPLREPYRMPHLVLLALNNICVHNALVAVVLQSRT